HTDSHPQPPPEPRRQAPRQLTSAVLGRPGVPGRSHPAALRRPRRPAVPDHHPAHAPPRARRTGQPPLDLPAPDARTAAYRPGDPPARGGNGPRQPDLGVPADLGELTGLGHRKQATLLTLAGAYRPPPGPLGSGPDQVILHRAAAASIQALANRVADAAQRTQLGPMAINARNPWIGVGQV